MCSAAGPTEVPVAVPGAFIAARVYVFERAKMIDGLAARMQSVDLGQQYGLLPADLDSLTPPPAGAAEFVLGPNEALLNLTDTTRVQVTWDPAPTIAAYRVSPSRPASAVHRASTARPLRLATACRSLHQRSDWTISTTFPDTSCIGWLTATTARKPRRRNRSLSVVRARAATRITEL